MLLFAPPEAEGPNAIYGYHPDSDFYYLTGWTEPGAAILISPAVEGKDKALARAYEEILFLPAHNYVQEKWTGPKLGPENPDATHITGFDRVEVLDNLRAELVRVLPQRAIVLTDVPGPGRNFQLRGPLAMVGARQRVSSCHLLARHSAALRRTAQL